MSKETYRLQHPITVAGQEIIELEVRRPKLRDMKKAQQVKNDLERSIKMLADLTEQPPATIEELDMVDFDGLSKMVDAFMPDAEASTP